MKAPLFAASLAACLLIPQAQADFVAADLNSDFPDTGFSGGWLGSNNIFISNASDLLYANYGITQSGGTQRVYTGNTSSSDRMDSRNLAAVMTGEIWFSVLVNVPATGNFAGLSFDENITTGGIERYSHALSELRVLMRPTTLVVDTDGGGLGAGSGSFASGATHLILGKMNIGAGADSLEVWIDPNIGAISGPGDLPAADYADSATDFMDSLARIGVPNSRGSSSNDVHLDAIRVSDTGTAFVDVTGFGIADTTDPEISALSPANGEDDVVVNSDLVATFSEGVEAGASGNIVIKESGGGTYATFPVTSSNVDISGAVVTIDPSGNLADGTTYYVETDNGALEDAAGNPFAGISGSSTWAFTTSDGVALVAADFNAGGAESGFSGAWTGSNDVNIVDAADLTYTNYSIVQTGSPQRVTECKSTSSRQDKRDLATPMNNEIWFSALVNIPSGSGFAGITFNNYNDAFNPVTTGARILMTPTALQVGFNGGGATSTGTFAAGVTHLILGKMNVGDGNDSLEVWIDPNIGAISGPGDLPTADFASTATDFAEVISDLGAAGSRGGGANSYVDAIRVSNTATAFVDVTGFGTADTTDPTISSLSPDNGESGVIVNSDLEITFSEPIKKGTSGDIVIQELGGGTFATIPVTSSSVSILGPVVTIDPSGNFPSATTLYVEIDPGAFEDFANNSFAGISGSSTWSFTSSGTVAFVADDLNVGGTETGFSGSWGVGGSSNVLIQTAPDLTYANYGIVQTGTTQRVYIGNGGADRQDTRDLATALSGEIWFSALVNIPTGSGYAGITFNSYGNNYDPITTGARILLTPSQLQVGFNGGGTTTGTGTFSAGTTHLLLGKMNVDGGNDTLDVWVDPDLTIVSGPGDLPASNYASTTTDFADLIEDIGVAAKKGSGANVSADAIRMSNTVTAFADVTAFGSTGGGGDSAYTTWSDSVGLTGAPGGDGPGDDADDGGKNNFYEFAFGGNPLDGNDDGSLMHHFVANADGDSDEDSVLTVLVRAGATWSYSGPAATATVDGVVYTIAGSAVLPVSGAVNVLEGTTVITTGLPAAPSGYEYKSFILEGSIGEGLPEGYFQATVAPE